MFTDVKAARPITWLALGYQARLFTLSLTVTLTLCCCSVPVSAACAWRRQLSAHVTAGTPRGRVANGSLYDVTYGDHGFHSWTRLCQNCHHQNRVWGLHLLDSRWSYHMINVWLISPSEHGFLTSLRDLRRVGDNYFFDDDHSLNSPLAEDAEDSFVFSRSFAFAFASSWFVFAWSQSLGCFLRSIRTQHGWCLSTFIV